MQDKFFNKFNENFSENELYISLIDEMSKYKTLTHDTIKWDFVFSSSLKALSEFSLDVKLLNFLAISAVNLNQKDSFKTLIEAFSFFLTTLKQEPNLLAKNEKQVPAKKKIFAQTIELFTQAHRDGINLDEADARAFNELVPELSRELSTHFDTLYIEEKNEQTQKVEEPKQPQKTEPNYSQSVSFGNSDISTFSDREFREYFVNLSISLLKNDIKNLTAYSLIFEAMWGRIKALPVSSEQVTQIRYPDENLILLFKNMKEANLGNLEKFIRNLALNPFWIDGVRIFCEFLRSSGLSEQSELVSSMTLNFIEKFSDMKKLKFQSEEAFFSEESAKFFSKKVTSNFISSDDMKKDMSFEELIKALDRSKYTTNSQSELSFLLELSKIFTSQGMDNNAKVVYSQIVKFIENTELKDYLSDIYIKAKTFL
ncbi:type VI secretion system domain-containing protein [Campylobacter concisus]|uniref:Type VI secretion system domain-containing protein n=1 Tax=Campylobacter concisus TaxID=199 RepID=A0A7S9WR22_9BACT|nr:type VI secretion system domain-containing protein [Campylobacter concisus]QPH90113.1 type VI secretion system domain-containing protein [Campylobacter concisus]VTX98063.1 VI_chp_7: type VI secretion-associated protein [Campylobacter concisus]